MQPCNNKLVISCIPYIFYIPDILLACAFILNRVDHIVIVYNHRYNVSIQ